MKNILFILMFFSIILLSNCTVISNNEQEKITSLNAHQIIFSKLINALDDRNSEQLKDLFSNSALINIPDIEVDIRKLFEFYQGNFISNGHLTPGGEGHKEFGEWVYLCADSKTEIKTDKAVYSLSFNSVAIDEENPNDVGLWGIWLRIMDGERVTKEVQVGIPYPGRGK